SARTTTVSSWAPTRSARSPCAWPSVTTSWTSFKTTASATWTRRACWEARNCRSRSWPSAWPYASRRVRVLAPPASLFVGPFQAQMTPRGGARAPGRGGPRGGAGGPGTSRGGWGGGGGEKGFGVFKVFTGGQKVKKPPPASLLRGGRVRAGLTTWAELEK